MGSDACVYQRLGLGSVRQEPDCKQECVSAVSAMSKTPLSVTVLHWICLSLQQFGK